MGTIANAKVTHYYNCYNGDFIGCLLLKKPMSFYFFAFTNGFSYISTQKQSFSEG